MYKKTTNEKIDNFLSEIELLHEDYKKDKLCFLHFKLMKAVDSILVDHFDEALFYIQSDLERMKNSKDTSALWLSSSAVCVSVLIALLSTTAATLNFSTRWTAFISFLILISIGFLFIFSYSNLPSKKSYSLAFYQLTYDLMRDMYYKLQNNIDPITQLSILPSEELTINNPNDSSTIAIDSLDSDTPEQEPTDLLLEDIELEQTQNQSA